MSPISSQNPWSSLETKRVCYCPQSLKLWVLQGGKGLANSGPQIGEFERSLNIITMIRKGRIISANAAHVSFICAWIQTENQTMDASTQILVWICRDSGLHFPLSESQAGEIIQCERCLLVKSLRKQVGELQEVVARLRHIHVHEEFFGSIHMETSKAKETVQLERTAFSALHFLKNKYQNRFSDANLEASLLVSQGIHDPADFLFKEFLNFCT